MNARHCSHLWWREWPRGKPTQLARKGKWLGHPDMDGWANRGQPCSLWTRPWDVLRSSTGETPVELVVPCEECRPSPETRIPPHHWKYSLLDPG